MRAGCSRAAERCAEVLKLHCVVPPGSELAFRDCMRRCDLERHLPTLEDSVLKKMEPLHPAARPFRLHRRYARLAGERWQVDEDGRVHPEHVQLGAATGRNACRSPNVVGIGRVLRPVVTAPPGRALIELDYGQIEIGIAGAEHGDQDLIRAYNDGDVYAVVAQHVFADELTEEERTLDPVAFREKRPGLRDAAKPLVLSILYGAGAASVAARMGVSKVQAQSHVDGFFALFPRLRDGLDEHEASGVMRGYAEIVSGLRRNTAVGAPDGWTRRMLRNTPVQGGGAVLFKKALVDMDRQFQGTDTWIVLPLHDGVLIECPVGEVDAVAAKAQRVMENAVRSYYPQLCPRVQVNKARPECWNKDGHADSLERFLVDPDYRLDGGRRA